MSKGNVLYIDLADRVERATPDEAVRILLKTGWKQARELIFEHPEPEAVVRAIPDEDIYLLIKQVGDTDALDIFGLASAEQVQAVFDFDCWDKDHLSELGTKHWFWILMETEDDFFISRLRDLDLSLLILFLKRRATVYKFEEIVDDMDAYGPDAFLTPDRRYMLVYEGEELLIAFIHEFTQKIYRLDMDFYYYILEAIYWESLVELEENAYADRGNRMEGRGFPDYYSSIEIFASVNPERYQPRSKMAKIDKEMSGVGQMRQSHCIELYKGADSFFNRLLAHDFPGRDEAVLEAMAIANMVAVAQRVSFADIEKVKKVVEDSNGYLNIGLEYHCGGDDSQGIEALKSKKLIDVYKIGRSLVTRLGRRAKGLISKASVDGKSKELLMLDSGHQEFVAALINREPIYVSDSQEEKSFTAIREVEQASIQLDKLSRLVALLHDECGLTPDAIHAIPMLGLNQSEVNSLGYTTLFCTAFANDILGLPFAAKPLHTQDLPMLMSRFSFTDEGNKLNPEAKTEFDRWLKDHNAMDLADHFEEFIGVMADELALVSKKRRPDVRYISSLLIEIPY